MPNTFLIKSDNFAYFSRNSKFEKENSFSSKSKTLRKFWSDEREFTFSNLEFQEYLVKLSLYNKNLFDKNTVYYGRIHWKSKKHYNKKAKFHIRLHLQF